MGEYVAQIYSNIKSKIISNISEITVWAKEIILINPLKRLYFNGPDLKSFGIVSIGFWNGLTNAEICAQLTTISERHWHENQELCDNRIHRQFMAFVVIVEFLIYIVAIFYFVKRLLAYCFPDQLTSEIRAWRKWATKDGQLTKEYQNDKSDKNHEKILTTVCWPT